MSVIKLRAHKVAQKAAFRRWVGFPARSPVRSQDARGTIVSATGSGKTIMAAASALECFPGGRILVRARQQLDLLPPLGGGLSLSLHKSRCRRAPRSSLVWLTRAAGSGWRCWLSTMLPMPELPMPVLPRPEFPRPQLATPALPTPSLKAPAFAPHRVIMVSDAVAIRFFSCGGRGDRRS